MKSPKFFFKPALICAVEIFICAAAFGSLDEGTNNAAAISLPTIGTARGFYNAGTEMLRAGKLSEAEALLQSSISKQDAQVQPVALYNLGQVRFDQGDEELKKSPSATTTLTRGQAAASSGGQAVQQAQSALAGNDLQQMVAAYIAGHGARKEMRAATEAVQRALEAHGKTLLKWRRAAGDFKSAAELNPADTNAVRNAEIVEQAIARLVDTMQQMQESAGNLRSQQARLDALLKQLKGRIPAANMPPGGTGGSDDDDDEDLPPEALAGLQESTTGGGQEMELKISPETAGQLLNGIQPDGKLLPMGEGGADRPKDNSKRIW